jgi:hypothetical protein
LHAPFYATTGEVEGRKGTGAVTKTLSAFRAGIQYIPFISPPGNFKLEHNIEFSLRYEHKMRWPSPVSFNPYARLFFTASGGSTAVLGKVPSFDVELGAVPTWELHPREIPVTLSIPTWLTVGPADFWGGTNDVGVFSTRVNARAPIEWVPQQYGQWSVNAVFVFAAGLGFHF